MLQLDDFTYEIKPLEASSKFEHLISQLVTQKTAAEDEKCEAEEKDTNQEYEEAMISEMPRAGIVYLWWPHRKALKVHYTVSHSLVVQNSNEARIIENIVIINNILHTIYYQGQLQVFIHALCIWSHRDQMNLQRFRSPAEAKAQFGLWKSQNFYANIPHDTLLLLTGHKITGTSYYSSHNGICNHNRGASYVYVVRYHIFLAATVGAHGIGLMGAFHDVPGCRCFRRYQCLVAPNPGLLDMMSNCTFEAIHQWLHVWDPCLSSLNIAYNNFPYVARRCGDKITDNFEECDCGTLKDCSKVSRCETSCILSLGSDCDDGDCCMKYKYAQPGYMYRDTLGICDLPEYCNRETHDCPADTYIQDEPHVQHQLFV